MGIENNLESDQINIKSDSLQKSISRKFNHYSDSKSHQKFKKSIKLIDDIMCQCAENSDLDIHQIIRNITNLLDANRDCFFGSNSERVNANEELKVEDTNAPLIKDEIIKHLKLVFAMLSDIPNLNFKKISCVLKSIREYFDKQNHQDDLYEISRK